MESNCRNVVFGTLKQQTFPEVCWILTCETNAIIKPPPHDPQIFSQSFSKGLIQPWLTLRARQGTSWTNHRRATIHTIASLEWTVDLICVSLNCGRKSRVPKGNPQDIQREHVNFTQKGTNIVISPRGEADLCTTVPPHQMLSTKYYLGDKLYLVYFIGYLPQRCIW